MCHVPLPRGYSRGCPGLRAATFVGYHPLAAAAVVTYAMFQKYSRHGEERVVSPTRSAPFQSRKKVTAPLDGSIYSRDYDGTMLLLSLETKNEEEVEGRTDGE